MTPADQPTTALDARARDAEWEDLPVDRIRELTARSARVGWRPALSEVERERPFFARRMRNLPLGNWHLLRMFRRDARVLDVGCGFGSLALGLAHYFIQVLGIDALQSRVDYAAMRAREEARPALFVQGSGLSLPFGAAALDVVTMNGVLEWAGLYADGSPRQLQVAMLREARRVLAPAGTLAVAIENRFAMETLVGMPDTHSGLRLVPALPRPAASLVSRLARRRDLRTWLYDAAGYRALLAEAGFESVRAYDLVSSYNDYDFIVDPSDAETYRFLSSAKLARTFHERAGRARRLVAARWPGALGRFGYAYLLLGGRDVSTVLDAEHPIWTGAAAAGIPPGRSRFACQGTRVGTLALVSHDAGRVRGVVELSIDGGGESIALPEAIAGRLGAARPPSAAWRAEDLTVRSWALG